MPLDCIHNSPSSGYISILYCSLHLNEIVEGLYFYFSLSVCLCVCVCVCKQNSSRTNAPIWMRFSLNSCLLHWLGPYRNWWPWLKSLKSRSKTWRCLRSLNASCFLYFVSNIYITTKFAHMHLIWTPLNAPFIFWIHNLTNFWFFGQIFNVRREIWKWNPQSL